MCVCVLLALWLLAVGGLLLFYCPAVWGSFVCGLLCYIVASLLLRVMWVGADFCFEFRVVTVVVMLLVPWYICWMCVIYFGLMIGSGLVGIACWFVCWWTWWFGCCFGVILIAGGLFALLVYWLLMVVCCV